MKQLALLLFFALAGTMAHCQEIAPKFKMALELTQKAWEFSQDVTDVFQFYEGAHDVEEIRYHSYEALSALDSLYLYAKKAEFEATDANYAAEDRKQPMLQQQALRIQSMLKAAEQSATDTKDKLSLVLDELVPANIDIQINQALNHFNATRKQLKQAEKELKLALKATRKNDK